MSVFDIVKTDTPEWAFWLARALGKKIWAADGLAFYEWRGAWYVMPDGDN